MMSSSMDSELCKKDSTLVYSGHFQLHLIDFGV